jgi:hypothetical protein
MFRHEINPLRKRIEEVLIQERPLKRELRDSQLELKIQHLSDLEAKQFEDLERRYTEDDLVFA